MPAPVLPMLEGFFATYVDCLQRSDVADEQAEFVELLDFYAGQALWARALRAAVRGSRTELRPSLSQASSSSSSSSRSRSSRSTSRSVRARARASTLSERSRGNAVLGPRASVSLPHPARALSLFSPAAVSDARARAQAVTEPHDYYALNGRTAADVDTAEKRDSSARRTSARCRRSLAAGENVVLLSNHQTEAARRPSRRSSTRSTTARVFVFALTTRARRAAFGARSGMKARARARALFLSRSPRSG